MKTIEERAKEYAELRCSDIQSEFHKNFLVDAFVSSYIQGASVQKNIDIIKGYEWLNTNLPITTKSDTKNFKYNIITEENRDEFITQFLKAIEE